jgi:hypothetical protein
MARTSAEGGGLGNTLLTADSDVAFSELLRACTRSAVHLEMRDSYTPHHPWFAAWRRGDAEEFERRLHRPWLDLIREVTGRGVTVRRARIVSEPVSDYIRFEHATTASNVTAGERVRWLPRRRASDLCLPGNDFWVFDDRLVQFNHFTGDGESAGQENIDDPTVIKLCAAAFEAVWERGIDHSEYMI